MTSKLVQGSKLNSTVTENGALTNSSTLSHVVDLYKLAGSLRNNPEAITSTFVKALATNKDMAVRVMLHARDIRGGMGERGTFQAMQSICLDILSFEDNVKIMRMLPVVGRWKDLFVYADTALKDELFQLLTEGLMNESTSGLVAKWLPREKPRTKKFVSDFCRFSGLTRKEYRTLCKLKSDTVEQKISTGNFSDINYSQLPSKAASVYQKLFKLKDTERYEGYLAELAKPDDERDPSVKVNAGAVFPYEVLRNVNSYSDNTLANAQWAALPDYFEGSNERILPMADVSGSMGIPVSGNVTAMDVGLSLAMYCAERSEGPFKDEVLVYSTKPYFKELSGDLSQRKGQLLEHVEYGSTNLLGAFEEILKIAVRDKLTQDDMPTKILIFSDMEFDQAVTGMNTYEAIKIVYEKHGYKLPQIIFWALDSRGGNFPVSIRDKDVAIVSGFSPAIMKAVLSGGDFTPEGVVKAAVNIPRYNWQ